MCKRSEIINGKKLFYRGHLATPLASYYLFNTVSEELTKKSRLVQ